MVSYWFLGSRKEEVFLARPGSYTQPCGQRWSQFHPNLNLQNGELAFPYRKSDSATSRKEGQSLGSRTHGGAPLTLGLREVTTPQTRVCALFPLKCLGPKYFLIFFDPSPTSSQFLRALSPSGLLANGASFLLCLLSHAEKPLSPTIHFSKSLTRWT